jgi:hypothetical protein
MAASVTTNSTSPDFSIFLTAYDPLDLASGSIDVLGFQRGYIALADKILPGFTTVTTTPRYVSMLCAAIGLAQDEYPDSSATPTQLRQRRLNVVKSYERAWALACGLAESEERIGQQAVDGLRGIQSVRRRLNELSSREKYVRTSSFDLLANQVRYGGIGAYSAFLEDCHLATMRSLSLRPLGFALAEAFPKPIAALDVYDEDQPLSLDELRNWGRQSHLGALGKAEAKTLIEALRGGEEGGWEDDVRWTMLRLLASDVKQAYAEPDLFKRILVGIQRGRFDHLKLAADCLKQIEAALVIIGPYEMLYQSFQFLFDAVRAAATDESEARLELVIQKSNVLAAHEAAKSAAADLTSALSCVRDIHRKTTEEVESVLMDAGIRALLPAIDAADSAVDIVSLVLDRHRDVQQGKFDKGLPKASWVRRDSAEGKVRLTAQRFQIPVSDRCGSWEQVPWHPYRTFGALRFIRQSDI